jgi:hypothetical protein
MADFLFIATIVFVAYVVFVVMDDKKKGGEGTGVEKPNPTHLPEQQAKTTQAAVAETQPETEKPVVTTKPEKAPLPATNIVKSAAKKPARSKPATAKPEATKVADAAPAPAAKTVGETLKNPKTGEVAKVPASYAFAKRWIKDALVEEGLLDKVYKNTELDEAANAKIQDALQKLKALDKYN